MFGGLAFLLRGHLCVCIWHDALIVRVGAAAYAEALACPFVSEFDITGRPMTGWVLVAPDGLDADAELRAWIERGQQFVRTLGAKKV
jgi:hypothetical protein